MKQILRSWATDFALMLTVRMVIALPLFTLWLIVFNPREATITIG